MAKTNLTLFIRQVRQETSKVTWPSRKETATSTLMVIVISIFAAVFFFIVDQILSFGVKGILGFGS